MKKGNFMNTFIFCITILFLSEFLAEGLYDDLGTVIGIDLGTSYSRVGVYRNDSVEIIAKYPSWVAFIDDHTDYIVGDAAKNQAPFNPKRTIFDFKRLIGKEFDDPDVQLDIKMLPYEVVNKDGKPYVQIEMNNNELRVLSPEEISAMLLRKMKENAESYLGKQIMNAVVSVPVYFTNEQRQAIKDAGVIVGLNIIRVINEPTAAVIAYGLDNKKEDKKNILVFDIGGGSFDVSILTIERGVFEYFASDRDTRLGGEDFDNRVMNYFIELIMKKYNKDISQDKEAIRTLRNECERAKRELSSKYQAKIEIDHFSEKLTRVKFEELNLDLFEKTIEVVQRVLKESNLEKTEIDEILLVGGSSRIPKVQELLKEFFNGKEPYFKSTVKYDEAVVYGAIVQGGVLSGEFALETKGEYEIFLGPEVYPVILGIETVGGVMTKLIPRYPIIPIKRSQIFTTYQDNQTIVSIKVYEGNKTLVKDCRELGQFDLSGIEPAPRGVPEIEVTFYIDGDAKLHVTAEDKATKNSKSITISNYEGLPQKELMFEPEDQSKSIAIMNNKKEQEMQYTLTSFFE